MSRDTLVGTTLAGYSIKDMVGEGGTSAVYRADHPQHGVVALEGAARKAHGKTGLLSRAFCAKRSSVPVFEHPNVVRTIETGESGPGLHYLAIEWAAGEILERYAKRNAPLPREEVARIVIQIGDAVQAAHSAGIVHRDLKPDNVMYDPESHQVKLLDFGIAAATDTAPDERLTRAGFFVGTLMYVAPEALSGELVTPAADQYSLATIAYFLLTGSSAVSREDAARDVHATACRNRLFRSIAHGRIFCSGRRLRRSSCEGWLSSPVIGTQT